MKTFKVLMLFSLVLLPVTANGAETAAAPTQPQDHRAQMRHWITQISDYAKAKAPGFIVVPHTGEELLTVNGLPDGAPAESYIKALSGQSFAGLFYGHATIDIPTSSVERGRLFQFIELAKAQNRRALIIDYCFTPRYVENSVAWNQSRGHLAFAADHVELNTIPPLPKELPQANAEDVSGLANAKNFLCLATSRSFGGKTSYLNSIAATNYDLLVIDPYFGKEALTAEDVAALGKKADGGKRVVLAYLSVGRADSTLPYWQETWQPGEPEWLLEKSAGSTDFSVQYWAAAWQNVIMHSEAAPLDTILKAGFDGVFLAGVDAYQHFEKKQAEAEASEEKAQTETATPEEQAGE